jgi:phosphohistidine swiveling domain-containing protein
VPWLVPLETLARRRADADATRIGGKAARLAWLHRQGFAVPETWVLPLEAFSLALRDLSPTSEPRSLLRAASGRTGYARAAEARREIAEAPLPRGLESELHQLWQQQQTQVPWGLAVRSSATCEDGALVSLAGLAETRLGVRGGASLVEALRAVWASVASGRALAYLAAHGVRDIGMAVVLQRMVRTRAAGVMFTRAPDRPPTSRERIVNASLGLGANVVDGEITPDVIRFDEEGRTVEQAIAHKPTQRVIGPHGEQQIPSPDPDEPALRRNDLADLADVARRLEAKDSTAWDVEFACDEARTWIVQARPVTGRGFPEGGDAQTVWSNANVGEALPGVATPLTWSVARGFSEAGFRQAFAALGCHVPRHAKLVALVHGRIYLNLTQFMRIAAQVPGLDPRTLIELGGGAGGDDLAEQVRGVSRRRFYARLPLTATRLVQEQLALDGEVVSFVKVAEQAQRAHAALDLAILTDDGLARTIRDLQLLLERTGKVMLSCASNALGSHLMLQALLAKVAPGDARALAHGLTGGIRDLESARPAFAILRVASLARREPEVLSLVQSGQVTRVEELPDGPARRALADFLRLYGDRAVREAELSTPRWREEPRPVLAMLQVALKGESRDGSDGGEPDGPVAARGQALAAAEMQRLAPKLGMVQETLLRHLVARAQKAERMREQMRAWVTRVLGMLRDAMLDADRRLRRLDQEGADLTPTPADAAREIPSVFFLTLDEVVSSLRSARTDLAPLLRARRAEHARDRARPDPPATFTGAPPPMVLTTASGTHFKGLAACAGVVEGRARVLHGEAEMAQLAPGEILVVHTTDVGWTPLFPLAAAVVTELGGPLSHAAIVARELGVPTVVNVPGITRAVRTGEWLRVDGDRGTVERLPQPPAARS